MKDIFADDLAARYADKMAQEPTGPTWQEREADLRADIASDPSQTVASFAWNFNDQYSRYLESLVASGDYAGAKSYYDSVRQSIEANRDGLLSIAQVQGAGQISDELARRANGVLMGDFNQRQVKLSDGQTVTLGQVLSDNSPFMANQSTELKNLDFSDDAINLYLGGDRAIKSVMDPYLRNSRGQGGIDGMPNHLQTKDLIESYAADRERINGIFGDGTASFLNHIKESHKTSGCGAATMRTLVDFAEAYSQTTGTYGRQLAADVANGYNNLITAVFRGDDKRDSRGGRYINEISDNQRREFDAMLPPALRETMKRTGSGFDMNDPRLRQGLMEVGDILAYTSALGGDMFSDARGTGAAINQAFGNYIAESMLGQAHTGANIVTSVRDMRDQFSQRFVGGRNAARVAASLSGQSKDYLDNIDKTNGTKSTVPAADNLAHAAHTYLARQLLPKMAEGKYHGDVLAQMLDENPSKLVQGLAAEFGRSFRGSAGKEFAVELALTALDEYSQNGFVCIEDLVGRLAYGKSTLSPAARAAGERWYRGNVPAELAFGDRKARLREHYLANGYTDAQAREAVASVSEQAMRLYDGGHSPDIVFDSAMNTGYFYNVREEKDAKGKVTRTVYHDAGRMDKTPVGALGPGMYNANRPAWDAQQKALEDEYKRQVALREYEEKKKIAQMTKDSM